MPPSRPASGALKGQVEKALGPNGEVKEIRVRLTGVEITGVRIRAPKGATKQADWPAEDELRAERILILPAFWIYSPLAWCSKGIRVEGAYISMLRAKNGQMKVLPSLLDNPANKTKPGASNTQGAGLSTPPISVGKIPNWLTEQLSSSTPRFANHLLSCAWNRSTPQLASCNCRILPGRHRSSLKGFSRASDGTADLDRRIDRTGNEGVGNQHPPARCRSGRTATLPDQGNRKRRQEGSLDL